ncbi:MAG: hypothetical protein IPM96_14535 [Ignavibacteria bacterium]|nr:hypothetical protein [Ignavibacteria bacterium]
MLSTYMLLLKDLFAKILSSSSIFTFFCDDGDTTSSLLLFKTSDLTP